MRKLGAWGAAIVLQLGAGPPGYAQSLSADAQASLLLRALAYDRNLATRGRDSVTVAIIFRPSDRASAAAKAEVHEALSKAAVRIGPLPVRVMDQRYGAPADLTAALDAGADVLYLTPGLMRDLPAIAALARDAKVATITGEREYLEQGVALGATLVGDRPKIVVNLAASKAQGMDLSGQLLQVAEVIDRPIDTPPGGADRANADAVTEPVFLSGPDPEYTSRALERGVEGLMIVRCVVSTEGAVSNCRVVKSLPFMSEAVVRALERRTYKPATRHGQPVSVEHTFNIQLKLPR